MSANQTEEEALAMGFTDDAARMLAASAPQPGNPQARNTTILESLRNRLAAATAEAAFLAKIQPTMEAMAANLSESARVNLAGLSVWLYVTSREDLQAALALAPKWSKADGIESSVDYLAEVDGIHFRILAQQAAIPPTCQVVEEEVEIAAVPAVPARKVKVARVLCPRPAAVAAIAPENHATGGEGEPSGEPWNGL